MGIASSASFRAEALSQRCCVMCGTTKGWHAHHVVYEQQLKRLGMSGHMLYDSCNAMRLCKRCHERHHTRVATIPTKKLLDHHIEYACHVLGTYAVDWLRRYYDDSDPDPRIVKLESAL